jgi:hypothetical protein
MLLAASEAETHPGAVSNIASCRVEVKVTVLSDGSAPSLVLARGVWARSTTRA